MKIITLLIIFFLFLQLSLSAQINDNYAKKSIVMQTTRFLQNGQLKPLGFRAKNLLQELKQSDKAMEEYKRYKKSSQISTVLLLSGLAANYIGRQYLKKENKVGLPIFAVGSSLLLVSIPFTFKSVNRFNRCIGLYNEDVANHKF